MSEATTIAHDVPEGWYTDPESPRMQRYWGGSDWSDHVRYSDVASMPRLSFAAEPDHQVASLPDHVAVLAYIAQRQPAFAAPVAAAPAVAELTFAETPVFA